MFFNWSQLRALAYKAMAAMGKSNRDYNAFWATVHCIYYAGHYLLNSAYGNYFYKYLSNAQQGLQEGMTPEEAAKEEEKLDEITKRLTIALNHHVNVWWLRESEEAIVIDCVLQEVRRALGLNQALDEAEAADEEDQALNALFDRFKAEQAKNRRTHNVFNGPQIWFLTMKAMERLGQPHTRWHHHYYSRYRFHYMRNVVRGLVYWVGYMIGRSPAGRWYREAVNDAARGLMTAPLEHVVKQQERLENMQKRLIDYLNRCVNMPYLNEAQERVIIELCVRQLGEAMQHGKMLQALDWDEVTALRTHVEELKKKLTAHNEKLARVQTDITETQAEITESEAKIATLFNRPPDIFDIAMAVKEGTPNGATVGYLHAKDPDADETLTFSITAGNDGGAFAVDGSTGAVTVADTTKIDFETAATHALTVQVSDSKGQADTATATIKVMNVDEGPVVNDVAAELYERPITGALIATLEATDPEGGALSYSITGGNDDGIFTIESDSGKVSVADSSKFDQSYALTVAVTDPGGHASTGEVKVDLKG